VGVGVARGGQIENGVGSSLSSLNLVRPEPQPFLFE